MLLVHCKCPECGKDISMKVTDKDIFIGTQTCKNINAGNDLQIGKSTNRRKMKHIGKPDMSDFDNRPTGDYVGFSPNTYSEQFTIRLRRLEKEKIKEIIDWINQ